MRSLVLARRGVLAASLAAPAYAQARPIVMVVPFPPGGSTDVMGRLLAEQMALRLGVPVQVENRGGSATVVGAEYAARAAPDGHTLLVNSGTTLTLNPLRSNQTMTAFIVETSKGDTPRGTVIDVCLIPETLARTNLRVRCVGDLVHVEADYLAKLVARQLEWMKRR
jgi:hypothetical protein